MENGSTLPPPDRSRLSGVLGDWLRDRLLTCLRGLIVAVMSFAGGIPLLVLSIVSLATIPAGVGFFMFPAVTSAVRALANEQRRLLRDWFGVEVPVPYPPRPPRASHALADNWRLFRWMLTDPATWRDLSWMLLSPFGLALGLLPTGLVVTGVEGIVVAPIVLPLGTGYGFGIGWALSGPNWVMAPLSVVQGVASLLIGAFAAPTLTRGYAEFARSLLGPTRAAKLAVRVRHLDLTRTATVDEQAAELRRIERDLHDGAQARLVSLGMSLGMAEDLLNRDPESARQLLVEARQASDQALSELRDLVRGIHPPVLAERGLDGAVRALALALPMPVDVDIEIPGRIPEPIETAAYFAVAEALANVGKHSGAQRVWIRLRHTAGGLRLAVTDDGAGGANPDAGTGLRGIERRLAAHDGQLTVASPPGGPTVLTVEVPCALSSPKT